MDWKEAGKFEYRTDKDHAGRKKISWIDTIWIWRKKIESLFKIVPGHKNNVIILNDISEFNKKYLKLVDQIEGKM